MEESSISVESEQSVKLQKKFNFRKIKLILRSNETELKKSEDTIKILDRTLLTIAQSRAKGTNPFKLIDQISQDIRALPEGGLKEAYSEVNWKYLIHLSRSLRMLTTDRQYICERIIEHDLPILAKFLEKIRDEAIKQAGRLRLDNAKISLKFSKVFPAIEKSYQELNDEIDAIFLLNGLIESIQDLSQEGNKKREPLNKKIEELNIFCSKNKGISFINNFHNRCFSDKGELNFEELSNYIENIKLYMYRIESKLKNLDHRIKLITNNLDTKETKRSSMQTIHEKIKKLKQDVKQPQDTETGKIARDIVDLKMFLLRLSSEEERNAGNFSSKIINEIISKIETLPDDFRKMDLKLLENIDKLMSEVIASMDEDPLQADLKNLLAIFSEILSLQASLTVGLFINQDKEDILKSSKKEIKKISELVEKIMNHADDDRGLVGCFSETNKILANLNLLADIEHPTDLCAFASNLLPQIYELFLETNFKQKNEVDFILFDAHKKIASALKKSCILGKEKSKLKEMILELKGICAKNQNIPVIAELNPIIDKIDVEGNFDCSELLRQATQICLRLEALKEEMKKNIIFSQITNKFTEIQKHLFLRKKLSDEARTCLIFYGPMNADLWGNVEQYDQMRTACEGLLDFHEKTFIRNLALLDEVLEKVRPARMRHGKSQNTPVRISCRLPVVEVFIGQEYDKANIDTVIKYLDILLSKDMRLPHVRAAMLAVLLIMGEAFKDLSPALKKSGPFKMWWGFYIIRNSIHKILDEKGRNKLEYFLKSSDAAVNWGVEECFQDLRRMRERLKRVYDSLPSSSELRELVETTLKTVPSEEIEKEEKEVILPPGLGLLCNFLIEQDRIFTTTERGTLIVLKKRGEKAPNDPFYNGEVGSIVKSLQVETAFLQLYSQDFSSDPEAFSLACDFSVAYCGDIARALLVKADYSNHLNDHFLNMHYLLKSVRGDLMHDRVLKAEEFEEMRVRYNWVSNEFAPCTQLVFCATKLEVLTTDLTEAMEEDFVRLNQVFNKKITVHFNRVKKFLTEALGEEAEAVRVNPKVLNLSAIVSCLQGMKEERKQEILDSINFLCSDYVSEMSDEFSILQKKWRGEVDLRWHEIKIIGEKISSIQENAEHQSLLELKNYAKEIEQTVLDPAKSSLSEQERIMNETVKRHREKTLNRNVEKLTYFSSALLKELLNLLQSEIKTPLNKSASPENKEDLEKRRRPGTK